MDFVGHPLAGTMLRNAHINSISRCSRVLAAVAYAQTDQLWWFEDCLAKDKTLEFFGRYDGTCPVDPRLLQWALAPHRSTNLSWRVVPTYLHAKVIWWQGSGVYIGSANMTDRAWMNNFEAGIYIPDDEIESAGLAPSLLAFFDGLRRRSEPLRKEHLDAQIKLERERKALLEQLRKSQIDFESGDQTTRSALNPIGVTSKTGKPSIQRSFEQEWNETLQIMRKIASEISLDKNRPHWIDEDVPSGVQADQFLHAYYFHIVRKSGEKDAYLSFHERNRKGPAAALASAIEWWKRSDFDYSQEQRTINWLAPRIKESFSAERLTSIGEEEWVATITGVHAFGQHARHVSNILVGLPPGQSEDAKSEALARWMWRMRTSSGHTALEVIRHVVWGGEPSRTVERLWDACNSPQWRFPHMKTSILGELVGWMNPDVFPPRNRRTSKGLRALGYNVGIDL